MDETLNLDSPSEYRLLLSGTDIEQLPNVLAAAGTS